MLILLTTQQSTAQPKSLPVVSIILIINLCLTHYSVITNKSSEYLCFL